MRSSYSSCVSAIDGTLTVDDVDDERAGGGAGPGTLLSRSCREGVGEDLQGDVAVQAGVAGSVDPPMPPAPMGPATSKCPAKRSPAFSMRVVSTARSRRRASVPGVHERYARRLDIGDVPGRNLHPMHERDRCDLAVLNVEPSA